MLEVKLHKLGAVLPRAKRAVKLDLFAQRNHCRGRIVHLKAVEAKRERDENTSEDAAALQRWNSSMYYGTVTKTHHLDRVNTSEVSMAMAYSAATSSGTFSGIGKAPWFTASGPEPARVFLMSRLTNKTRTVPVGRTAVILNP